MTDSEKIARFVHGTLLQDPEECFSAIAGTFCATPKGGYFDVKMQNVDDIIVEFGQRIRVTVELVA